MCPEKSSHITWDPKIAPQLCHVWKPPTTATRKGLRLHYPDSMANRCYVLKAASCGCVLGLEWLELPQQKETETKLCWIVWTPVQFMGIFRNCHTPIIHSTNIHKQHNMPRSLDLSEFFTVSQNDVHVLVEGLGALQTGKSTAKCVRPRCLPSCSPAKWSRKIESGLCFWGTAFKSIAPPPINT